MNKEAQSPLILLGDFNQKLPRPKKNGQPIRIYELLIDAIPDMIEIATAGLCDQLVDHITHTRDLNAEKVSLINKRHPDLPGSSKLSDHFGVAVDFRSPIARP